MVNVTADGVLLDKGPKSKKEKQGSFLSHVFKGGLDLLSYDSSSLHQHEARVIKKSMSVNSISCIIVVLSVLILFVMILLAAMTQVGTIKQVILSEEELTEYEVEISAATMPLHNYVKFSQTDLKDKLDTALWAA